MVLVVAIHQYHTLHWTITMSCLANTKKCCKPCMMSNLSQRNARTWHSSETVSNSKMSNSSFGKGNGLQTTAAPFGKPKFEGRMDVTTSYVRFQGVAHSWKLEDCAPPWKGCLWRRAAMYNAYKNTWVLPCGVYFQLFRVLSSVWKRCSILRRQEAKSNTILSGKCLLYVWALPWSFSGFMLVSGGHFLQHRILPHISPAWQAVWVDQDELVTAAWRGTKQRNPELLRFSSHDKQNHQIIRSSDSYWFDDHLG